MIIVVFHFILHFRWKTPLRSFFRKTHSPGAPLGVRTAPPWQPSLGHCSQVATGCGDCSCCLALAKSQLASRYSSVEGAGCRQHLGEDRHGIVFCLSSYCKVYLWPGVSIDLMFSLVSRCLTCPPAQLRFWASWSFWREEQVGWLIWGQEMGDWWFCFNWIWSSQSACYQTTKQNNVAFLWLKRICLWVFLF